MNEAVPETRQPLKTRSREWVQALAVTVAQRGYTPNQVSLAGIACALLGFALLYGAGRWPAGWIFLIPAAGCVLLRLLCNALDGLVALEGRRKEKGRELFNEVPNRIEDTLFFVGAGFAALNLHLGWLCSVLAIFAAFVRVLGSSLGQPQDFGGPCAMPQRMALLTVALVVEPFFQFFYPAANAIEWMLGAIAVGTAITAALRLRRVYARTG